MSAIAVIPARGGSKRIPKKNIRPFAGRPMISHVIEAARISGLFDQIVVSTDSDEIASISESCGATAPFRRPAELCDDYTGVAPVMLHAIREIEKDGKPIEEACLIYATAPLLTPINLRKGIDLLHKKNANSVFSVATFPSPVFRSLTIDDHGRLRMAWPEHEHTRSQDLPVLYHDAGQFHWVNVDAFKKAKHLYMKKSFPIIIPRHLVQDIDTEEDWRRAELLYAMVNCEDTAHMEES